LNALFRDDSGRLRLGATLFVRLLCGWGLVELYRASHSWMFASLQDPSFSAVSLTVPYLVMSVSWALLTWVIFRVVYRVPFERLEAWRTLFVIFVPTVAGSAVASVCCDYVFYRIVHPPPHGPFWHFFMSEFHPTLLDSFIVLGIACAIRIRDEAARRDIDAAQLETQLAIAQMQALRSQMQPHFLFNTLHSISAMLHEAPGTADTMIAHLGALLRMSIDSSSEQEVPLSAEVEFARRYLDLQQMRFSDRLTVQWDIDRAALDVPVPTFLLQPLVENSVKHGLAAAGGGIIRINAALKGQRLVIRVVDNGQPAASDPNLRTDGIGINNTRARLAQLYGPEAGLTLQHTVNGTTVTLRIPLPRRFNRTAPA
jgi:two-component system LytT family sensor kinase